MLNPGEPFANVSGSANNMYEMMKPNNMKAAANPVMKEAVAYRAMYPEVYFKLKPYIIMACDQMDAYGIAMPTQQQLDKMSDAIYDDACKMHPDMAEYMRSGEKKAGVDDDPPDDPPPFMRDGFDFDRGFDFGRRRFFRRRGLGRDLISLLLLEELFGRRRFLF